MRPTLTPMQTMMLVRLHLSAGPIPDDEWTTDEWPEVRRLREAGLAEHHHGFASTAPDGAAIAQRAIDALAAWDAVHKHLLQVYPRPHGCTILPTGDPVPAGPDWLVWSHASARHDASGVCSLMTAPPALSGPRGRSLLGKHADPMQAVLMAAAVLEGEH